MKTKILAGLLLAGSTMFAAPRFGFGINIGVPAPVVAAVPPCPGPGYVFINGYWQLPAGRVVWHDDHFARFDRHVDREHFRR
jgi:hypothetical protein